MSRRHGCKPRRATAYGVHVGGTPRKTTHHLPGIRVGVEGRGTGGIVATVASATMTVLWHDATVRRLWRRATSRLGVDTTVNGTVGVHTHESGERAHALATFVVYGTVDAIRELSAMGVVVDVECRRLSVPYGRTTLARAKPARVDDKPVEHGCTKCGDCACRCFRAPHTEIPTVY